MNENKEKKEKQPKPVSKEKQAGKGKKEASSKDKQVKAPEKAKRQIKFKSLLFDKYRSEICPHLMQKFGYKNKMQIPSLVKVVVNTCLKEAVNDSKILDTAAAELSTITCQRPVITKAKKSISNFKLRVGLPIGACVTLRNNMMYEFVNRLVNVALPRVRDFRGISAKGFDGRGNYTLGLTEQTIFPEIDFDKVTNVHGMNITFVTTAKTDAEAKELLSLLGVPFRK